MQEFVIEDISVIEKIKVVKNVVECNITIDEFYNSMVNQRWRVHYEQLVTRAIGRVVEGYVERHHIIPKCLGGSNKSDNLVKLTAEEHYVAHQLLIKCFPKNRKIAHAIMLMTSTSPDLKRSPNKSYKWLRELRSESMKGTEQSAETRAKISISHTGKKYGPRSEETCLKISIANKGRTQSDKVRSAVAISNKTRVLSEESMQKWRISRKDYVVSEQTKAKISAANKGKVMPPVSEETRAKLSIAAKNRVITDEQRANLSIALKNRVLSEEAQLNISKAVAEANRNRIVSDESRAKMSASRTGIVQSDETKAKRKATMLATMQRKREEKERLLKEGVE